MQFDFCIRHGYATWQRQRHLRTSIRRYFNKTVLNQFINNNGGYNSYLLTDRIIRFSSTKSTTTTITTPIANKNIQSITNGSLSSSDQRDNVNVDNNVHSKRTPLYNYHIANEAKMTTFAEYQLPISYVNQPVSQSHLHTRRMASIFDVSHMQQTFIYGRHAIDCLESLCTADLHGLQNGSATLTVFTAAENGGILDDLIVTRISDDYLYVVTNAGCRKRDCQLLTECVDTFKSSGHDVGIEFLQSTEYALLAIQGPKAVEIVQKLCPTISLNKLYFMQSIYTTIAGIPECRITRCGYTGEDGVEISLHGDFAERLLNALQSTQLTTNSNNDNVIRLAGLGARDSLRLEAGLCLYGTDLNDSITPIEAALAWTVAPRRRRERNFPGASTIMDQLTNGTQRRRIGIRQMTNGPTARTGTEIYGVNDDNHTIAIGHVTSGCPSPSLGGSIAMGYLNDGPNGNRKIGSNIQLKIRGRFYPAIVCKMPFVAPQYYTQPKK